MAEGLDWAGSLVSSRAFLLAEVVLAEVADAVADRAGAEAKEIDILDVYFDRTGPEID